jgi:streptogramin lyase
MRLPTCIIAAGMFVVAAIPAGAATVAYGEAFDTLYRIDLTTHQATKVGAAGRYSGQTIGNISGLSTTADGTLYAAAGGFKLLVRIDPESGQATVIGDLGLHGQGDPERNDALDLGMAASCGDTLWLSSAVTNKLWTVDPVTGTAHLVGSTGHALTGIAAYGDQLYGAGGKGDNTFYRIDPSTGAATAIGPFGHGTTRWINSISMSFDETGTLWAVVNYVPPEHDTDIPADWSDLATIDPATGTMHVIGPITGPETLKQVGMKGFTTGPAPCGTLRPSPAPIDSPWMLGALIGLLALAVSTQRHRLRL